MFALVSLLCLLAVANYAGAERVVRGEPHGWLETDVAPEPNELVEFRLALHQRNVDKLVRRRCAPRATGCAPYSARGRLRAQQIQPKSKTRKNRSRTHMLLSLLLL